MLKISIPVKTVHNNGMQVMPSLLQSTTFSKKNDGLGCTGRTPLEPADTPTSSPDIQQRRTSKMRRFYPSISPDLASDASPSDNLGARATTTPYRAFQDTDATSPLDPLAIETPSDAVRGDFGQTKQFAITISPSHDDDFKESPTNAYARVSQHAMSHKKTLLTLQHPNATPIPGLSPDAHSLGMMITVTPCTPEHDVLIEKVLEANSMNSANTDDGKDSEYAEYMDYQTPDSDCGILVHTLDVDAVKTDDENESSSGGSDLTMDDEESSDDDSDEDSDSESDDDSDEGMDMMSLLLGISTVTEDVDFANAGYEKVTKICNSLQGELYQAQVVSLTDGNRNKKVRVGDYVAIKKINKELRKEKVAEKDDMTYCVEEDIKKEAAILKHLTVDNTPTGKDVARFIEFFESDTHIFLVTEYVDGMTLFDFVKVSFSYIKNRRFAYTEYRAAVHSILYQMACTISWLHNVYHCCHMDLCLENVMVHGVTFKHDARTKKFRLHGKPKVKLIDFGVAEVFDTPRNRTTKDFNFECAKSDELHEAHNAPESTDGTVYDARAADMWSLGMMMYEMVVGSPLYEADDIWDDPQGGYYAVRHKKLREYLARKKELGLFKRDSYSLLEGLLNVKANKRMSAAEAEKHSWFKHFSKNNVSVKQRKHNEWLSVDQRKSFPYYNSNSGAKAKFSF